MLELGEFLSEFNRESPRGAVLVAASRLDDLLKRILLAYLREAATAGELVEGFNAPLGTFAARASAAHALGLIEDQEYEEITIIRKIRNEYGHKWKDVGFSSPKIKVLCGKLPWLGPDVPGADKVGRGRFTFAAVILLTDLMWREALVRKERRQAKTWGHKMRGAHA